RRRRPRTRWRSSERRSPPSPSGRRPPKPPVAGEYTSSPRPRPTTWTVSSPPLPEPQVGKVGSVFITFLSDFGLQDDFVGTCHGVIKRIAPEVEILDITHGIEPQQVLQGAFVLANTLPYMPSGVHLAVVDPGVGSSRRGIVLRSADERTFVGPDNGLLLPAAEQLGEVTGAWELANPAYRLDPVSFTFHGRDVFAPAAAYLANGLDTAELGPQLEPSELVRLPLPEAVMGESWVRAHVLVVGRFGIV